eukprot:5612941-Prymnesium_polylepis.1
MSHPRTKARADRYGTTPARSSSCPTCCLRSWRLRVPPSFPPPGHNRGARGHRWGSTPRLGHLTTTASALEARARQEKCGWGLRLSRTESRGSRSRASRAGSDLRVLSASCSIDGTPCCASPAGARIRKSPRRRAQTAVVPEAPQGA